MNYKKVLIPVIIILLVLCVLCGGVGTWYVMRLNTIQGKVSKTYDVNTALVDKTKILESDIKDFQTNSGSKMQDYQDIAKTILEDLDGIETETKNFDIELKDFNYPETKGFTDALTAYNEALKTDTASLKETYTFIKDFFGELVGFEKLVNDLSLNSDSLTQSQGLVATRNFATKTKEISARITKIEAKSVNLKKYRDQFVVLMNKLADGYNKVADAVETGNTPAYDKAMDELSQIYTGSSLADFKDVVKDIEDEYNDSSERLNTKNKVVIDEYDKLPTYLKKQGK